jgi:hypothetical protein
MTLNVVLLLIVALSADVTEHPAGGSPSAASAAAPRRYHEINQDIRDVLRAEVRAGTQQERAEAIKRMCALHEELAADPRLEASPTLKSYKAKLWSRMTRIQSELERQLPDADSGAGGRDAQADLASLAAVADSMADHVSYLNDTLGGPSYVFSQSGGALGGGMVNDHSQELIDLIQRTIQPDHWDVNGGPGSMFYYRPLMALVVRATSEVHGNVGGLLDALRRAGQ